MEAETGHTKGFRIVLLIAAAFLLFGFLSGLRAITSVFIPYLSELTGLSYGDVSIAFMVMNIILAVAGPLFGLLTLKVHTAKIMIAGAVLGGIGFIGTAFSTNLVSLIVFMGVFFGLGSSALAYSLVFAAAIPVIGEKYSILLGGIIGAAQYAFGIILSPLIAAGTDAFGLPVCLIWLGIISLCTIPLCFLFLRKKETNHPAGQQEPRSATPPVSLMFLLIMALGKITYGVCDGGMVNHLTEFTYQYTSSGTVATIAVMVYSFCTMAGCILGGIVCARVKNSKSVAAGIFLFTVLLTVVSYLIPISYAAGYTECGLYGIAMGMCLSASSAVAVSNIPLEKFAFIYSVLGSIAFLGYALDSYLGGLFYDLYGDFMIMEVVGVVLAAASGAAFFISWMKDRKKQGAAA